MSRIAVWAGIVVVLAAIGGALDGSPTDGTIPAAVTTTTVARSSTTAAGSPTASTEPVTQSTRPRTPAAVMPPLDEEVDCNNWEDYADSGEYDIEDIADICGLDEADITDWENG